MTDAERNGPEETFHDTERKLRARIEALEAALTQSRAETAAAYERAADSVRRLEDGWYDGMSAEYHHHSPAQMKLYAIHAIRALATPDQTSALDAVRAEARAQGMREAAEYMKRYSHTHMTVDEILAAIKGAKA